MNDLVRRFLKIVCIVFVFCMMCGGGVSVQAIGIGKEYITTIDSDTSFLIPCDGKYKITVKSIVSTNMQFNDSIWLYISDEDDETVGNNLFLSYGEETSDNYVLPQGEYWFNFNTDIIQNIENNSKYRELQYVIIIEKIPQKRVSYPKMKKILKKYTNSFTHYNKGKNKPYLIQDGVSGVDGNEQENYLDVVGMNAFPYMRLYKSEKSSYVKYSIEGQFLSASETKNYSDICKVIIGNSNKKITYDVTDYSESVKYNKKDAYYEGTCKWKVNIFATGISDQVDVQKLIQIIKGKDSYIHIKGEHGAYFKIVLDKKTKKQWIQGLEIYKKILKLYK